jgi:phosphoribosyl 1,2-cyclic phosphate phosphodiesterase
VYGPAIDFYEEQGFVKLTPFRERTKIGTIQVTAIQVDRGSQLSFIYVFEKEGRRIVYAPCDIKPFPEDREDVQNADLLVIQPGIFEDGLKHGFNYPKDHISRTTLYTFDETRSHDDYITLEEKFDNVSFAYDGMRITV